MLDSIRMLILYLYNSRGYFSLIGMTISMACHRKQEIPCIIRHQVRNLVIGFRAWSMDAHVPVSGCDEDVAMRAVGEEFTEIECCIIRIIEQD
jgi:hypothetical protein